MGGADEPRRVTALVSASMRGVRWSDDGVVVAEVEEPSGALEVVLVP